MPKVAFITGISGQDGSYAAELLLRNGYEVHGLSRHNAGSLGCSQHLERELQLHYIQTGRTATSRGTVIGRLIAELQPDELYHFAADSFVPNGWQQPLQNIDSNLTMSVELLEAVRQSSRHTRMVNACSREVFGAVDARTADEQTPMRPNTPYGINKAASRSMVQAYRERYELFVANAILFNHESPRRGEQFVTRKTTMTVAAIRAGRADKLSLGSLSASRDWGFAGDYVDAMWRMLQTDEPGDFVIGTGVTHTVEQFVSAAFSHVGLNWRDHVATQAELARRQDDADLAADCSRAQNILGWQPATRFQQLVAMMVDADINKLEESGKRLGPMREAA